MPSCRFALALLLVLCLACEAAVVLTDAEGAVWTQYTDDETGMPYYHDAKGGRTQWTLPTAAAPAAEPAAAEAEADPEAAEQAVIDTIFGTAAAAADDAAAAAAEPAAIDAVFGTAPAAAGAEPIAKQQQPVYGAARTLSTPTRNNPDTAENPAASASEWSVLWDIAQKAQAAEAAFVPKGDGQVLANPEAAESADYAARWAGDPGMLGKHKGAAELVRKLRAECVALRLRCATLARAPCASRHAATPHSSHPLPTPPPPQVRALGQLRPERGRRRGRVVRAQHRVGHGRAAAGGERSEAQEPAQQPGPGAAADIVAVQGPVPRAGRPRHPRRARRPGRQAVAAAPRHALHHFARDQGVRAVQGPAAPAAGLRADVLRQRRGRA